MSEIGTSSGALWVGIGLLLAGVAYNRVVEWIEQRGYDEGYTALLVVVGVGLTLVGVAILDLGAAALALAAFALSGLPMVTGSIWRHVRRRERAQAALRREVLER
jgi:hypothetical protein